MELLKLKVGADPELFMMKGEEFISAHGVIPGTKKDPYQVKDGAVQVDGMALEFNIDPAIDEEGFLANLNSVMNTLIEMVGDKADSIVASPVAEFSAEYFAVQPVEAKELGCDPDYSAWEYGEVNPKPDGDVNFRTGAGHIHVGWTEGQDITNPEHIEACIMMAKQLDCYLGVPSVLFDGDIKRRELYGAAGAFRPKPYGVEYRTLSNKWLESEELIKFIYRQTEKAFKGLLGGVRMYENFLPKRVINESRVVHAKEQLRYYPLTSDKDFVMLREVGNV